MQAVACFDLNDGDRAFLFWNAEERKLKLTSDHDPEYEEFTLRDVRSTIYWALGLDPYTASTPVTITGLTRKHTEILEDGSPWLELCSDQECAEFLDHDWDGYAANKIFLLFAVTT